MSNKAITKLTQYQWPGNVRELENVMQRAMILATNTINAEHICLPEMDVSSQQTDRFIDATPLDMKTLERRHILDTLEAVNGSRKLAVQRLGISERTLRYKLQQYRVHSP